MIIKNIFKSIQFLPTSAAIEKNKMPFLAFSRRFEDCTL